MSNVQLIVRFRNSPVLNVTRHGSPPEELLIVVIIRRPERGRVVYAFPIMPRTLERLADESDDFLGFLL